AGFIGDQRAFRQENHFTRTRDRCAPIGTNDEETLRDDQRLVVRDDPLVLLAFPLVAIEADAHRFAVRRVEDVADEYRPVRILIELRVAAREVSYAHE